MTAVIDICATASGADGWAAQLRGMQRDAPDFLATFAGALARAGGLRARDIRALLVTHPHGAIDALADGLGVDIDDHAAGLREGGVRRAVLHGSAYELGSGTVNDHVLARAARHPDVLEAWCGVELRDEPGALEELDRCADAGARGVTVLPFVARVDAEAPAAQAVYARAAERGLPVWLHCGYNASRRAPMTTPAQLDRIAARHPDLTLIAGHGGWPYVGELIAVLMRQPNVYIDTSAHHPGTMAAPGSGWEPLLHSLPGVAARRVLFGSATHVHGATPQVFIDGVRSLGLAQELQAAWLHDNAARILGIADREGQGHGLARA